jgi:murein DD-endopeptidase MepM/ murein hydrolase activator NlpD
MSDNKHLTPVEIMYVDGKRLDVEHEGALKEIVIKDVLNGISSFYLLFDNAHTNIADKDLISLESEVSIHLGYKDDIEEVFCGEVLKTKSFCHEYGTEQFEVSGRNVLHKLSHGEHTKHYEKMSPSDIIKKMIESFSLKAKVEDFGTVAEFSSQESCTAYDYLLRMTTLYGKEYFADKDTIYVANEITIRNDEIILEWGKSLIGFESSIDMAYALLGYDYVSWDVLKGESFTGGATLEDLPVKVGGDKDWTKISKGGDEKYRSLVSDMRISDVADAKERAKGILQKYSFLFSRARGKCEGNYRIRPGMRVTVKGVGTMFEGEYIAEEVLHKFSYSDGYTTTVTLKRNMVPGTASTVPSPMQQQQAASASENSFQVGQDVSGDEFTDEMKDNNTKKDSREVILSDQEKVTLSACMPITPIEQGKYTVTDGYGPREPVVVGDNKGKKFHDGIDMSAPVGTPVRASYQGVVTSVMENHLTFGNAIIVTHPSRGTTFYAHLDTVKVKKGDTLVGGQVIGTVGSTGFSTGPHLHYEVCGSDGKSRNPGL